jgi:hypothetical protein
MDDSTLYSKWRGLETLHSVEVERDTAIKGEHETMGGMNKSKSIYYSLFISPIALNPPFNQFLEAMHVSETSHLK